MQSAHIEQMLVGFVPWVQDFGNKLRVSRSDSHAEITKAYELQAFINQNGSYDLVENRPMEVPGSIDFHTARQEMAEELFSMTHTRRYAARIGFYMPNPHRAKYLPALELREGASGLLFTIGSYITMCIDPRPVLPDGELVDCLDWRGVEQMHVLAGDGNAIAWSAVPSMRQHTAGFYAGECREENKKFSFTVEKRNGGYILSSPVHFEHDVLGRGHLTSFLDLLKA